MHSEAIHRQIALVSYGTQFLRNGLALDDWYRHGIFFGARLQFRQLADNALLADDFTWWLGMLKQLGAERLSLHLLDEFDLAAPAVLRSGEHALVVHFPDHYQIWVVGEERAAWLTHALLPDEPGIPIFPDSTSWGGALDSYWCIAERPGKLAVPETNWRALADTIATDLETNIPSSLVPAGPVYLPSQPPAPWANFALFPGGKVAGLAHGVLATLYREQSTFANDTHIKNDSSYYKHLDDDGAAQVDEWGRRLDGWISEVELRCANECRQTASDSVHIQLADAPAAPQPARTGPGNSGQREKIQALLHDMPANPVTTRGGRWLRRLAFLLVMAVVGLLVLAIANVIAGWPWLALLIALPFAVYAIYIKD